MTYKSLHLPLSPSIFYPLVRESLSHLSLSLSVSLYIYSFPSVSLFFPPFPLHHLLAKGGAFQIPIRAKQNQCLRLPEICDHRFKLLHVIDRIVVTSPICFNLDLLFGRLYGSSGCLGKLNYRNKRFNSVNDPLRGRKFRGRKVLKPSISESFWTSSTCEMDNSTMQSRGSISSISTSNMTTDHGSSSGNISTEFVNHGFLLWSQTRQRWMGNKKPENRGQQLREPKLSWSATYESLLGSNKPFAQPVPLSEMVDFLVDIWEQDGMYD